MTTSNLILSGGIFHPFASTSKSIGELLSPFGIESTVTEDIDQGLDQLVGLPSPSLLTVNALRWRMAGEKYDPYRDEWHFEMGTAGRTAIHRHLSRGGGILALHTASICFDDWDEWGAIVGGAWKWGHSFHPEAGRVEVRVQSDRHPITSGLSDFELDEDEVYSDMTLQSDVDPLLSASNGEAVQPLCWAREVGGGRVVYDALGHGDDTLSHPVHRRIIARSALWCLGRESAEIEAI